MLVPQRSAYMLQKRLNQISTDEYAEFERLRDLHGIPESVEAYEALRTKLVSLKAKYTKRRNRAIWWYQNQVDIISLTIVLAIVSAVIVAVLS